MVDLKINSLTCMRREIRIFQLLPLTRVIWQLRKWDLLLSEQIVHHHMQALVKTIETMILIDSGSELGQIMAQLIQATADSQEATMRLIEALP